MPDIANNASTTSLMGVNATFVGTLALNGDRDWVRVSLGAGESIQVNLNSFGASAMSDPFVRIYNSNGALIGFDDDGGSGANAQVTFQALTAGSYYIEAASWGDFGTGDYEIVTQLTASPPPVVPAPPAGPLQSIAWGTRLEGSVVNVYFAPSGQTFDGYTSEGLNAYERGQIQNVFADLSEFIDLDFNIVTDRNQADLVFVLDMNEISSEFQPYLGYFNPPGENGAGIGVFNGDLWDRTAGGDLERGGYGYVTIVHELLHGLGLAHPHDNGGSSTIMQGVTSPFDSYGSFDLNQGVFTVMTYNSGYHRGANSSAPTSLFGGDFGFEGGAMALDIAYLQLIYGANTTAASGNSVYVLPHANASGTYWEAIWDTGGVDTISYAGNSATTIDLRAATLQYETGGGGFVSSASGIAGGFTIANGVVIENARGGSGRDSIRGNESNNTLIGANGHDTILGDSGNDRIIGGNGNDRLLGNNGDDRMYGGNRADFMNGGNGNDRLYGNDGDDQIYGLDGYDRLVGQDGDDELIGGKSSDRFFGGAGQDVMTGNGGRDRFSFVSLGDSVVGARRDAITNFAQGFDVVNIRVIDANADETGNQAFTFIGGARFSGTAGELRYIDLGDDVIVAGDVDGDRAPDFEIMLYGVGAMESTDFLL